jgi:Ca2+-binding RTX toxin-like protein
MPVTQPDGAITTIFDGTVADQKFAPDGSLLVASGSSIFRLDAATGAVLDQYDFASPIIAFDLSADGRYLVAGSANWQVNPVFYRLDLQTDTLTQHSVTGWPSAQSQIGDIAVLSDGDALVISKFLPVPLVRFDFTTGTASQVPSVNTYGTLVASADRDTVFIIGQDVAQTSYLYSTASGLTETHAFDPDPFGGASLGAGPLPPVGAVSPDESTFVYGTLQVSDDELQPALPISFPVNAAGMAFSPDGDTLYVALTASLIAAVDVATRQVIAIYPLDAQVIDTTGQINGVINGDVLQISGDGRYLTVMTTGGVQAIDLTLVVPIAGPGNDVLEGPWQFGLAGDDTYHVGPAEDRVVELPNQGHDTILATANWLQMTANVEDLTFVGSGNAVLAGNGGDNVITGGAGADNIAGGPGADTLRGGGGDDTLSSRAELSPMGLLSLGADTQHDSLFGEGGNDILAIDYGDDADGGTGTDALYLSFASLTGPVSFDTGTVVGAPPVNLGGGVIQGFESVTFLQGTGFNDTFQIAPQAAPVTVYGAGGNDTVTATTGPVQFSGEDGDDTFFSGSAADTFNGGAGFDTVLYTQSSTGVTLTAGDPYSPWTGPGGDTLTSVERIIGSTLADTLSVGTGNTWLWGDGGNDTLIGGAQRDELVGGDGDDTLIVAHESSGAEVLEGDAGFDTLEVRPTSGSSGFHWFGNAAVFQVEQIRFASTTLYGLYVSLWLDQVTNQAGGGQLTHLVGGDGYDFLTLDATLTGGTTFTVPDFVLTNWSARDQITLGTSGPANYTLNAREGLAGLQYLYSGTGNDTLVGSSGVDFLDGGSGVNVLNGNGGDDTLMVSGTGGGPGAGSTYDGGAGTDVLNFSGAIAFQGTVTGIEGLSFTPANGVSLPNGTSVSMAAGIFAGLPSALTLSGTGSLTVNLAPGNSYNAAGFVVAAGASITHVVNGSSANDTIRGLQTADTLYGNAGNDTLIGGGGDDILDGGAGADTMTGGGGNDTYYVDSVGDVVNELTGQGIDTLLVDFSYVLANGSALELLATIDPTATTAINLTGNTGVNTITGNAGANVLTGGGGADTLFGLGGDDTLVGNASVASTLRGGAGDDWYFVYRTDDTLVEVVGEGSDRVFAGVSYTLAAGRQIERLNTLDQAGTTAINLTGNEFGQQIFGNAGANLLTGGGGADTLFGLGGNDTLVGNVNAASTLQGGAGDDWFYVNHAGDSVIEAAGEGSDRVLASVSFKLTTGQAIERLQTANQAGTTALNLTGNAFGQTIFGNDGANLLTGGGGNDTLLGFGGNDTLVGNADAASTLQGGTGDDRYLVNRAGDSVIELAGEGSDRVLASVSFSLSGSTAIERLETADQAGTGAINLTGNALGQAIFGNAGANVLSGGGGADTLLGLGGNDTLVGNADAASTLQGGAGDDWYFVHRTGDSLVELAGEGNDRLFSGVNYALSASQSIETMSTLDAAGTTAINLTGNELDQLMLGNAGANVLSGSGGADTLIGFAGTDTLLGGDGADQLNGGLGADVLNGGAGADLLVFADALGGGNVDSVVGFTSGQDRLFLENDVFTGLAAGGLAAGAFATGTAAADADDRIVYDAGTGSLWFDADGNGAGAAVLFATLTPGSGIVASDIVVV